MKRSAWLWPVAVLIFCFSFCLPIMAETSFAEELGEEFLCENMSSENALISVLDSGEILVSFGKVAPVLSGNTEVKSNAFPNNAIRIALTNRSSCQTLTVTYEYSDEKGNTVTEKARFSLGARGVATEYYIYTDMADRLTHIALEFSGVSTGSITVSTINTYSISQELEDACGKINSCVYDGKNTQVRIRGSIHYDIMTANRTARLSLYAVRMGQGAVPYGSKPIATAPMSSYFDFRVPVPDGSRFYAYIVAVEDENGNVIHSFSPRVPCSDTNNGGEAGFFKGALTDVDILAARADAGMKVVDVDISEMLSAAGNGYMYALDGLYYYFDRSYVTAIDAKIKKGYENGMEVYLRLIAPDNTDIGLPGLVGFSDMYTLRLYAITDFLCDRYSNSSRGYVSGIIFGKEAAAGLPETMSLKRYAERYAESLYAVHEAIAESGREVRLAVPISDGMGEGRNLISHVFLRSLVNHINGRFCGGIGFAVMIVESTVIRPDSTNMDMLWGSGDFLERLQSENPMIEDGYLCCWEPMDIRSTADLCTTMALGYYTAVNRKEVKGFLFSSAYFSNVGLAETLFDLYLYIDTQLAVDTLSRLLYSYGISEWEGLVPNYDEKRISHTVYRKTTSPKSAPFRFLGEAYLWDFAGLANDYGWSVGDGCESLMMKRDLETDRALVAEMTPSIENNFLSEMVYRFDTPGVFPGVDTVSFNVRVDAPSGRYHVTVQVRTENAMCEAQTTCEAGELTRIYVNTAGLVGEEGITCIRIFTSPATENAATYSLAVGSISAHSTTVNAVELEAAILGSRRAEVNFPSDEKASMESGWIYVLSLAFFVGVAVVLILSLRADEERKD